METLRIHISLCDSNNSIDLKELKPEVIITQNEPEEEEDEEETPVISQQTSQKRKRFDPEDDYDLEDDWIDDSDLYYAQGVGTMEPVPTGKDWNYGFFAWKGDVSQFLSEHSDKRAGNQNNSKRDRGKRGSSQVPQSTPVSVKKVKTKVIHPLGEATVKKNTKDSSSVENLPREESVSTDVHFNLQKTPSVPNAIGKSDESLSSPKPLPTMLVPLHPHVQIKMDQLKIEAQKETWENKKIFPPHLKAIIHDAARTALSTKTFKSEHFVPYLTTILPYNSYTMRKLLGKMIIPEQLRLLKDEIDETYKMFQERVEYLIHSQEKEIVPMDTAADGPVLGDDTSTPSKTVKFRWDEELKALMWNILCLEWEMASLDNDLQSFNKGTPQYNEANVRKAVYSKMITFWPEGMMDSQTLSRLYSNQKARIEKSKLEKTSSGILLKPDPFTKVIVHRKEKELPIVIAS